MGKTNYIAILGGLFCSFLFPFLETTLMEFVVLSFLLFSGIQFYNFNILHPFVWLAPFIFIYNSSFCLLEIAGFIQIQYIHEILFCTYLSIISLFFCCILFLRKRFVIVFPNGFINEENARLVHFILILLSIMMILYLPLFIKIGYTSKKEMNLEGGLPLFGIISRLYYIIYTIYIVYYCGMNKKMPKKMVIVSMIITLGSALIIGERDVFLTVCLLTFLVYYYYFKVSFKKVLLLAFLGLIAVAIMQSTKQITNADEIELPTNNMFEATFGGEFATSGVNLNVLMSNKGSWKYQNGEAFFKDLKRATIPEFISKSENSTGWYNNLFNDHVDSGFGMGFSYIGEGYLQFGYIGVVIWTVMLFFIVLLLYKGAQMGLYGFVTYIYMIGMILYAMRGDLSYIISPLLKQILLTYILLKFVFKMNTAICRKSKTINC